MKKQLGTRHSPHIFNLIDELIEHFKEHEIIYTRAEIVDMAVQILHAQKIKDRS